MCSGGTTWPLGPEPPCNFFFFGNFRYPPELPPIYTKPPDTKKLSLTPPIFHFLSLRTLQGYNGYINIYMPIIPSTPKLRRFGQNGVVLQILGFFFLAFRGGRTTPKAWGGFGHPHGVVRPPHFLASSHPNFFLLFCFCFFF
jgi:hypothetical protein